MYHIIELENGQPMIFEQSARQIKSYLIANGRVFSKGYVFKDFKKTLMFIQSILHLFPTTL